MNRAILIVLGLAGLAALLFFGAKPAAAAESVPLEPGDTTETNPPDSTFTFTPPPADSPSNPEVGDVISAGGNLPVTQAKIDLLAQAIATAEGFFNPNPAVVPRRAHNPGNLTKSFGFATFGTANSEGVLIFGSDDDGWSALKQQVSAMLSGTSRIYRTTMTLSEVAGTYTGGDNSGSWATNAAAVLGISPDETLADYLRV